METTNGNTSKRRRLRISLRLVMLLVLVAAVFMGDRVNKARKQREAVAAVKKYGGWVHYDWELVNGKVAKGTRPPAPRWLRKLLGDEYFQEIAHVSLVYDNSTGKRLVYKSLRPADDILALLGATSKLKVLLLMGTQSTDEGLEHLRQLTSLEQLYLWDASHVSDAGVAHMKLLRNLTHIRISNSKIGDGSLAILAGLPKLESMSLQGNDFSDAGLAFVKDSTQLKQLCLGRGHSQITDAGLAHLRNLKKLERLDLQNFGVTDAGLEQLKGLTKLKEVFVGHTRITEDGKARFKAEMPNLKIIR